MKNKILIYTSIIMMLCVNVVFVYSTGENYGIRVDQTKIVFEADDETKTVVPVKIENNSNEEMSVEILKKDFVIADDGAFQIKDAGSNPNSANDFIEVKQSKFVMQKNTSKIIEVKFSKDKEFTYPELLSTVLVRYIPLADEKGKSTIITYTQIAITVRALASKKLFGELDTSVAPVSITKISSDATLRFMTYGLDKKINIILNNAGKITVEPQIKITQKGKFSDKEVELISDRTHIFPEKQKTLDVLLEPTSGFDIYTVNVSYEYSYGNKKFKGNQEYSFLMVSYTIIIGFFAILIGLTIQIIMYRKKSKMIKALMQQQQNNNNV